MSADALRILLSGKVRLIGEKTGTSQRKSIYRDKQDGQDKIRTVGTWVTDQVCW